MARLQTLKSRTTNDSSRLKPISRYGQGRSRYEPGRDSRRERVFKRDGYLCQMHKERGELLALELHSNDKHRVGYVDHYIPLAQGGPDTESNQWLLCKTCHDAKSAQDSMGVTMEPRDFGLITGNLTVS